MQTQARRAVAVAATVLMILTGCSSDPVPDDRPAPARSAPASSKASAPQAPTSYVALGDSFTAGPGISPEQDDSGFCQRSTQSWPRLLAASLDLEVSDVSCSGATTADLASTVASGAVRADTGLVTVSAGGNDGGLFLSLIRACTSGAEACRTFVDRQVPDVLDRTTTDLAALLEDVKAAAPTATVVLVGYPRILPETGSCEAVGIDATDARAVVSAEAALDDALAAAAERAGVQHVSLRSGSRGHDACAGAAAWTNGARPAGGDGIFFHPNRRGMAGVAEIVAAQLEL